MRVLPLLFLAAVAAAPRPAAATESHDSCTGTIASLPTTLATGGIWCFDKDLATSISSGVAITVTANNVTIDCNGFRMGGLGGGPSSIAWGIYVDGKSNLVVRNCNIRGFHTGVAIYGNGSGHLIENNRFDGNINAGINLNGSGSTIRGNLIIDTGSTSPNPSPAAGIFANGTIDILDNTIDGVTPTGSPNASAYGIKFLSNSGSVVAGNRVRNLFGTGTGVTQGIVFEYEGNGVARDNVVYGSPGTSTGFVCNSASAVVQNNVIMDFTASVVNCATAGNLVN